jgi:hypothetical protein
MKYLYIKNLTDIQKEFYDLIESDLMGESIKVKNDRLQNIIDFFSHNKNYKIDFLYIIEKTEKRLRRNETKENTDFRALNPLGFIIKFLNHKNINPILRKKTLDVISKNSTDEMFSLNSILNLDNTEMKKAGIPDFYNELGVNNFKLEISNYRILKLLISDPLQRYRKLPDFSEKELNDIFDDIKLLFTNEKRKLLGVNDYNSLINENAIIDIIAKEQKFKHENLNIIEILIDDKNVREEFILQLYADTYKKNFLQFMRNKECDPVDKYKLRKMIEGLPYFDYNKIPGDSNYPEDSFVDTLYKNQEHHKLKEIESYITEKTKLEKDFALLIETQIKIYISPFEDTKTRNASLKKISENMNYKTFEMYAKYKGLQLDEWLKTYKSKISVERHERNRYQKVINLLEVSKINVEKEELDNLFTSQPQNNIKQRL